MHLILWFLKPKIVVIMNLGLAFSWRPYNFWQVGSDHRTSGRNFIENQYVLNQNVDIGLNLADLFLIR